MSATSATPPEWLYRPQAGRQGERAPLSALFRYAATQFARKRAVFDGVSAYTFEELEHGAQRIAALLREGGVRPQCRVVVLSEKRALLPMLSAAIWKLGATYVPLDSDEQAERLRDVLQEVQPAVVLGPGGKLAVLGIDVRMYDFVALAAWAERVDAPRVTECTPADESENAYIIYTSGSSGRPKGVMISHTSLLDYFYNHNRVLRFTPDARVLSFAPFHFDVSIEDTLLPLSLGAYVYQFRGMAVAKLVVRILQRERITHMIAVSSLLTLVSREPQEISAAGLPDLQMVMTGAEVCDPKIINLWKTRMPHLRVINAYGPTEATIVCLTHTIETPEAGRMNAYPIGRPLDGVCVKLVGESGDIRRPGEPGELWIGGSQVMMGYFGRPMQSARRILERDGVRYYRSGDVCRYDAQGCIEFIGRNDDEVKLAGRRVGLGELRQFALGLYGVSAAAVGTVAMDEGRQVALVLVSERPTTFLAEVSSGFAGIPPYLRPRVIALAPNAPLTSTGKLDELHLMASLQNACSLHGVTRYVLDAGGEFVPLGRETACTAPPQSA